MSYNAIESIKADVKKEGTDHNYSKQKTRDLIVRAKLGENPQELVAEWRSMKNFMKYHSNDTLKNKERMKIYENVL